MEERGGGYGLSHELAAKRAQAFSGEDGQGRLKEAVEWVVALTGAPLNSDDLQASLRVSLCLFEPCSSCVYQPLT